MARWSADPRSAAVAAALEPYSWRDLTERMLVRRVLSAADRYSVTRLIHSVPGAAVGALEPLEPAPHDDVRADVLARSMRRVNWRGLALERLCADLLAVLDAWQSQRDSLDSQVRRLFDDF